MSIEEAYLHVTTRFYLNREHKSECIDEMKMRNSEVRLRRKWCEGQ